MEKIRFITDSASDMNSSREDVTILPKRPNSPPAYPRR